MFKPVTGSGELNAVVCHHFRCM